MSGEIEKTIDIEKTIFEAARATEKILKQL